MSKYITHHKWKYIKFNECPYWLRNRAYSYARTQHPVNAIVRFKGKHFRYNVYYDENCRPWKVYRRLRWKHNPKKHKSNKKVIMPLIKLFFGTFCTCFGVYYTLRFLYGNDKIVGPLRVTVAGIGLTCVLVGLGFFMDSLIKLEERNND